VGPGLALLLLFGSLIGSYFNIPIAILPGPPVRTGQIVEFFGMRYAVPLVVSWPGTVLAVNVGGAVIPTLMSAYLVIRYQLWLKAALATAAIAFVIHSMATPVPGIGIAVPVFAPVVTTAILAFILSREYAAPRPISAARWERSLAPIFSISTGSVALALPSPRSAARGPSTASFSPAFSPSCSPASPRHRARDRPGNSGQRKVWGHCTASRVATSPNSP
jgi:hypothetical protein